MLRQRIFGLALGHEDLRDHAVLRHDRLVCAVSGKRKVEQQALAGKSTLTRPELSTEQPHGYKKIHYHAGAIDAFLVQMFVEAHASAPERHLLCGRLRTADPGAAAGSREEEVERIVEQIRQRWPEVQIIVRGDSGFRREELMK